MIKHKDYIMPAGGSNYIYDPELSGAGAKVLSVIREGQRYYAAAGTTPSSSEYLKENNGKLNFLNAPDPDPTGISDINSERVTIILKLL